MTTSGATDRSRTSFWNDPSPKKPTSPCLYVRLEVEELESRVVPYAASGSAWLHPELITISIVPDGTNLGGVSSNLNAVFNAKFGAKWQTQLLKAAQTWAQQTNLNFTFVLDNGAPSGSGDYQQGNPGFGDIRIGGFSFGNSTLALATLPPTANNYSVAGDIAINTGQSFNVGSTYDLFTVAMHEIGHTLGLVHSGTSSAVQYGTYLSTKTALHSDDINGIKAIYGGARAKDAYDQAASNGSFGTATIITGAIDVVTKTALVPDLDITAVSDVDYFKFTVPAGGTGPLTVAVQSQGLSLLAPVLKVYSGSQALLKSVSGLNQYGATLTATLNVTAGQTYYVLVDGADATAFGTGAYALSLGFAGAAAPAATLPNTQTANGSPLTGSGGIANQVLLGEVGDVVGGVGAGLGTITGELLEGVGSLVGSLLLDSGEGTDRDHGHDHGPVNVCGCMMCGYMATTPLAGDAGILGPTATSDLAVSLNSLSSGRTWNWRAASQRAAEPTFTTAWDDDLLRQAPADDDAASWRIVRDEAAPTTAPWWWTGWVPDGFQNRPDR